jgi:2-haloacid dehalogenase
MIPEAVVFDIGNVLIEWNPERFYDRRIGQARRRALFAEVDLTGMNEAVDFGAPFAESVAALALRHPGWHDEIQLWHTGWVDMASPEIPRSVRLLRALKARGIPVFALSNFGVETFDLACAHYPFLNEFDRLWVSGHLRQIKPDAGIYATLEADSGIKPEALLFTDDRPENIAAAWARGWRAHLFEHPRGWADRLVAEGLLSAPEAR